MKSIRRQLAFSLVTGFIAAALLCGFFIYYAAREALMDRFDDRLKTAALAIVSTVTKERNDIDVDFKDRFLRGFDDEVGTDFYQLTSANGEVLRRSESLEKKNLEARFGTMDEPVAYDVTLPNGERGRAIGFYFAPFVEKRDRKHVPEDFKLGLVVAADARELHAALATIQRSLFIAGIAILLTTLAVVHFSLRRGLHSVERLANRASQLDANTLDQRFEVSAMPVELRPVGVRLNELLARLQTSFERERRFSSDVAHELRTPLAELRSMAEVALKWPDPDQSSRTLAESLEVTAQMEAMVVALLAISRSESGKQSINAAPLSLPQLIHQSWAPFADRAAKKEISPVFTLPIELNVASDADLLRLILRNLFDNAVTYSPRQGAIDIELLASPTEWKLVCANTAIGLAPADLHHLFERFWQKDSARTEASHSGLGLALVKALADLLNLKVAAALPAPDRFEISVSGNSHINAS